MAGTRISRQREKTAFLHERLDEAVILLVAARLRSCSVPTVDLSIFWNL